MEIATGNSLIVAAEAAQDSEALGVLKRNLVEEIAMADWLFDHLAPTTLQFLGRESANMMAGR